MKRIARKEEKIHKALEREAKNLRQKGTKNKGATKKRPIRSRDTANLERQKICEDKCEEVGLQHRQISEHECAVCFGHWEENDADECSGGGSRKKLGGGSSLSQSYLIAIFK